MRRLSVGHHALALSALLAVAGPAKAALIVTPTFASSITSLGDASQVEAAITTAITAIDSLYANIGTIPVLFEYNAGLGGGAETDTATYDLSYSTYVSKLTADATANPANSTLSHAIANLPSASTLASDYGTTPGITVTGAFANIILKTSQSLCFDASGTFHSSCGQSYEAVVTVSAPSSIGNFYTPTSSGVNSTAVSAVEHELDEVLGGGGAGTTLTDTSSGNPSYLGPTDLYRYASTGGCTAATGLSHTLSWNDNSATIACYSLDGGETAFAQFNQSGGGSDYGDFTLPNPAIQDAYEPSTDAPVYSTLSPEYIMMESIGYNPVPEPSILGLFAISVVGLGWRRVSRRGVSPAQA